jgi:hypothetical protein
MASNKEEPMRILLFLIAVLAFLSGMGILASAKSAVHEIEGFILFLLAAICLSGDGIIEAVLRLRAEVVAQNVSKS